MLKTSVIIIIVAKIFKDNLTHASINRLDELCRCSDVNKMTTENIFI